MCLIFKLLCRWQDPEHVESAMELDVVKHLSRNWMVMINNLSIEHEEGSVKNYIYVVLNCDCCTGVPIASVTDCNEVEAECISNYVGICEANHVRLCNCVLVNIMTKIEVVVNFLKLFHV